MQSTGTNLKVFYNFTLTRVNWKYVGEGGRHLIISLSDKQLIIRLRKYSKIVKPSETAERERYHFIFYFHYALMAPLLGRVYSVLPVMGKIPDEEIVVLNNISSRPRSRKEESIHLGFVEIYPNNTLCPPLSLLNLQDINQPVTPDTFESIASYYLEQVVEQLATFLTEPTKSEFSKKRSQYGFPIIAVEIKPKQGWIPLSERKLPICIFCAHQYTKLINGSVFSKSEYCPLDFFSGDLPRLKTAIKNLMITPQNNLKIFKNGQIIYEGKDGDAECNKNIIGKMLSADIFDNDQRQEDLLEKFCNLLAHALNSEYSDDKYADFIRVESSFPDDQQSVSYLADYETKMKSLTEVLSNKIEPCNWSYRTNKNTIIGKILRIQQLDQVGLEKVFAYYKSKSQCGDYDYINKILPENGYRNYRQLSLNIAECYALASVAKDCSIFVMLQKVSDSLEVDNFQRQILKLKDEKYLFNVTVGDIGPKPLSCIEKHVRRNKNVVDNCCKYFSII